MKQLTVFRILTFILVPLAVLFGVMDLLMLLASLGNPAILLAVFVVTSFVIYTFASLRFLSRVIDTGRPATHSLRDWVRVNAYVASFMAIMMLMNAFTIFFMSDIALREYVQKFLDSQAGNPAHISEGMFISIMKACAWFFLFVGLILISHIRINFRLLRQYAGLFRDGE